MMHQVFPYLQAQQQGQQTTYAWNRQVRKRAPYYAFPINRQK